MIWIAILIIIAFLIKSKRVKKQKIELNDKDLMLFYMYKDMINSNWRKLKIHKQPENLSEWEKHIWLLASQDVANEHEAKSWKTCGIICITLFVLLIIALSMGDAAN